ncbi:MAG: hypothetical protein IKU35_06845 [Bacteroidaceae bacterium]|nr:hypothetical protein [Bacteroidaceae bacterium]
MTYDEYIRYHLGGDAGVEEKMIASLSTYFRLSRWDSFRLAYYYTTTYHIPSALKLLRNHNTPKSELKFRTDRRYVRIGDNFSRIMKQLSPKLLEDLDRATTTTEQYNIVSGWYFFGRYASFLFLEVWAKLSGKQIIDDLALKFEQEENYTKGAEIIAGTQEKAALTAFIERAKTDTRDNVFSLETSLCAVAKLKKGTRWNGFYTERLLTDIAGSEWENLIITLL